MSDSFKALTLLNELESVAPGVCPPSNRSVPQGTCFCFKGGAVYTFNSEVACRRKTVMPQLREGFAIQAEPTLKLLKRLGEEDLTASISSDDKLLLQTVKGNKKAGITIEPGGFLLEIEPVQPPKLKDPIWAELSDEFTEALARVRLTASDNGAGSFALLCIHLHPEFIESADDLHMSRYTFETGITEPLIVRADAIESVFNFGVTQSALRKGWIHFKTPRGLIVSCQVHDQEINPFPDLDSFYELKGKPLTLPKGLADITDTARIFSDNREGKEIKVEILKGGKCRITGENPVTGFYTETRQLGKDKRGKAYDGVPLSFWTKPEMLKYVGSDFGKVALRIPAEGEHGGPVLLAQTEGGKFKYVCSLAVKSKDGDE